MAAAPALLAAETAAERSEVSQGITAEMGVLGGTLAALRDQDEGSEAAGRLSPVVMSLNANLLELDRTVAYRLQASDRLQDLLEELGKTDRAVKAVLSPGTYGA